MTTTAEIIGKLEAPVMPHKFTHHEQVVYMQGVKTAVEMFKNGWRASEIDRAACESLSYYRSLEGFSFPKRKDG